MSSDQVLELIENEPYPEQWVFKDGDEWLVTTEWLVGPFAGRAFSARTKREACAQMVEYFNDHLEHESIVGIVIRESGWPDFEKVSEFTKSKSHCDE